MDLNLYFRRFIELFLIGLHTSIIIILKILYIVIIFTVEKILFFNRD